MSLDPSRFHGDEYVNTNWTVTVEAGTSIEDVLNPAFFANIAVKMHQYDRIRVRIDTGEWYAELLVLDCARTWAKTFKLSYFELVKPGADDPAIDDQYFVKHNGPHYKFCVIRKTDKEIMKEGFATKQEAHAWLAAHILSM